MISIAEALPAHEATILFLAANPATSGRLSLDEEARDIEERIQTSCRVRLALRTRWAVRPDDVLAALNQDRPVVVHFSGHGAGGGGLVLHDEAGLAAMVSGKALRRVFAALKDDIRVVVLNACYSEEQARFIAEAIDCVVGMSGSIGDRAARVFAAGFYRALGHGRHVQNAFDQGLAAIDLEGLGEEDTPRLLVRHGVAASDVFLRARPQGEEPGATSQHPVKDATTAPRQRRVVIVLEGTPEDVTPEILARLTEALRDFSGDWTAKIETITKGSIRLVVVVSEAGEKRLLEASSKGKLLQLAGFNVMSIKAENGIDQRASARDSLFETMAAIRAAALAASDAHGASFAAEDARPDIGPLISFDTSASTPTRVEWDPGVSHLTLADQSRKVLELIELRHGPFLYKYCHAALSDADAANEVCKQVFIEARRDMHRRADRDHVRAWLLSITNRRIIDNLAARALASLVDDRTAQIDEGTDDRIAATALMTLLEKLPERSRAILFLRHVQNIPINEIAEIYRVEPGTIRSRLSRTLRALQPPIEELLDYAEEAPETRDKR